MPPPEQSTTIITVVLSLSVFGLVLTLWLGIVLLWVWRRRARASQVAQRLGAVTADDSDGRTLHLWSGDEVLTTRVPVLGGQWNWLSRLEQHCAHIGWTGGALSLLVLVGGAAVVAATLTFLLTLNVLLAAGVGGAFLVIFRAYFKKRLNKRLEQFDEQLVSALGLAARSLRAGHPLVGAFQMVAEEMLPPVREIFAEVCGQHEMGASIPDALHRVALESHSDDMKLVATSVAIQSRTGGNLAELMDRLAVVVKDRLRLGRRVRVLTAQTQFSKRVLLALPVIVFLLLNIVQPEYMTPLYTTSAGQILMGLAVCGLMLGAWLMDRFASIQL